MSEQDKYVLYDYLEFIWNKKWLLVIATVIGLIVGSIYSYTRPVTFTGKTVVFTGTGENTMLSKVDFIKSTYKELLPPKLQGGLSASIPSDFQVNLVLTGTDKESTQKGIDKISSEYVEDLSETYNKQYEARKAYSDALKNSTAKTEELLIALNKKLVSVNENQVLFQEKLRLEKQIEDARKQLFKNELKIAEMEKPKLMDTTLQQNKTSVLLYSLLAGVALMQVCLVLVVFWKYIRNARRN